MSSHFRIALAYLAVAALLEASAIYVMQNYERVPVKVFQGFSKAASENDYLALQRLIVKMGRPARSLASLYAHELPPTDGVLIVPIDRSRLSEAQHQRLLGWVAQGGDLFVVPPYYGPVKDQSDPVLLVTGVRQYVEPAVGALPGDLYPYVENWVEYDEEVDDPEYAEEDEVEDFVECEDGECDEDGDELIPNPDANPSVAAKEDEEVGTPVHVPGEARDFRATLSNPNLIGTAGGWQVPGETASYVVREPWGKGSVTVLSTSWFLMNHAIGQVENAELAWSLISTTKSQGPVWILYGIDAPALWDTIRQHWWQVLVALALLVIAVIWRFLPRVGAPIAPLPVTRRELLEHVEASGRFMVDHAASHVLLDSVQKQARKKVLKRYPQLAGLPEREKRARLAAVAKLSQTDIDVLYRPHVGLNRNDFVTVQRHLERIIQSS